MISRVEKHFPSSQTTLNKLKFLQYDLGLLSGICSVIIYSDDSLTYIRGLKIVVVDGSFKLTPHQFYHLLTIQGYLYDILVR